MLRSTKKVCSISTMLSTKQIGVLSIRPSGSASGSPRQAFNPRSGAVGSSYDNALAETINGLYKKTRQALAEPR